MSPSSLSRTSITIIGGGASGVILAAHLLRDAGSDLRVTLIERQGRVGQGLAYSALLPDHTVNVPARGMSAFADDRDHFWRWLQRRNYPGSASSYIFVPRRIYGAYLEDMLAEAERQAPGRLTILTEEAVDVRETPRGVETVLANGTSILSHFAVLAVGHETQPARGKGIAVRVGSEADTPLPKDAPVMILGSGLSMVDAWIALATANHTGPITVVSRNGLLPRGHRDVAPLSIDSADVPFGTNLTYLMGWFRDLVRQEQASGGDWRSVVDGLRPFNQKLWQSWPKDMRARFLRHLRPYWNVHRHRIPPHLHERLAKARAEGQVTVMAGEFIDVRETPTGVEALVRPRGRKETIALDIARVYDCGGVSVDVGASSNPLVRNLVADGRARPDQMRIGLDVDTEGHLIDAAGNRTSRIRVIGPLTRGQFFEIEAIPDIRVQCAATARQLLAG